MIVEASPCWRITRIELKVLADHLPWYHVLPGRQDGNSCRATITPSTAVMVTAHTRGVSGSKKPHGSIVNVGSPLSILRFP